MLSMYKAIILILELTAGRMPKIRLGVAIYRKILNICFEFIAYRSGTEGGGGGGDGIRKCSKICYKKQQKGRLLAQHTVF